MIGGTLNIGSDGFGSKELDPEGLGPKGSDSEGWEDSVTGCTCVEPT
jgi:hypothetical protein